MIQITDNEASSLRDFIEFNFIQSIRDDVDVDSLLYVYNILNIYKKCGGLNSYADYKEEGV